MVCKVKVIFSKNSYQNSRNHENHMALRFIQNSSRIPQPSAPLTKFPSEKSMNNKKVLSNIRALLGLIYFLKFSGHKFFRGAHRSGVLQNSAHKTIKVSLMSTSKRIWPHYERLRSRVAIGDQKDSLDYHQQCLATTFRRGSKESSSSCFAPWGSILVLRSWRQASQQWVGVQSFSKLSVEQYYFVSKIVLTYCMKKLF